MSFVDDLMKQLGGPVAEELEKREGLSSEQAQGALESLAPIILGGLKRKKEQGVDVDGYVEGLGAGEEKLDSLGGFFDGADELDLGGGGIIGLEKGEQTAEAIAKKTGIGVNVARKILPILIPIILSYLMKKGRQDKGTPTRKSGLEAILDRNGDGRVLDDIAGMVLAGRAAGGKKGGLLAMILSFFMGRK
ncbi:MAG: DUF937 domain-containing protein [Verrucomicrobiota bacterium JB023]|nr:DUF937 domain-containing protein [Verrucomicrobiota bacterium JB023]